VHHYAREFGDKHKGKWVPADRLCGFCLLVKRVVLEKIGPELEPWSDLGLFDTDILSAKARQAGYKLGVCRDLYIHHFGTRTFTHTAPVLAEEARKAQRT
jgi:GT2 family glycosyltransferase